MRRGCLVLLALIAIPLTPTPAAAQASAPAAKPSPSFEINWGFTQFQVETDTETTDKLDHTDIGGGFRMYLLPQVAVGGEVNHLRGPGADRDWVFAGKGTWDLMPDTGPTPRSVVP